MKKVDQGGEWRNSVGISAFLHPLAGICLAQLGIGSAGKIAAVLQSDLPGVWKLSDGIKDGNKWHVYVSSRHTGPVYVKGSKSPNQLFIDYVVLTKDKVKLPK